MSLPRAIQILELIVREQFAKQRLQRTPEPSAVMDDEASVRGFHEQGSANGPLLPIYHFNALSVSALAPEGGFVLDLGSGSGQFLGYLAQLRPDLRIMGLDLSPQMVALGQRDLEERGLSERVALREGDMTRFLDNVPGRVDVVSSVFSLHHLPDEADLKRCLEQVKALHDRDGCGVWIFDHERPRSRRTAERFPEVFTPQAAPAFRLDSQNSLIAAYDFVSLTRLLDELLEGVMEHGLARLLPFYQIHRLRSAGGANAGISQVNDSAPPLPKWARKDFQALCSLFPKTLRGDFHE